MATATTTRNLFFTWPDDFRGDFCSDIAAFAVSRETTAATTTQRPYNKRLKRSQSNIERPILVTEEDGSTKISPRKAKSVHFADSKGLALVTVKIYNAEKELEEAFTRLYASSCRSRTSDKLGQQQLGTCTTTAFKTASNSNEPSKGKANTKEIQLISAMKIAKRVESQKVCLEKTVIHETKIRGYICVLNLAYEKSVSVIYTFDDWKTHETTEAEFQCSNTDEVDRFVFEIPIPKDTTNLKVQFAVSYSVPGNSFWDNNNGFNYHVLVG